uniref:Uncharacterized protein n=1 Tax=Panagrolaimus sp. PS1159 TaxID=55785 RepID=A0AC35GU49_9BILA
MSTLSDLINADDTSPPQSQQPQASSQQQNQYPSPSSQATQFTPQQSFQSQPSSSQVFYPQPSPQSSSNIGPSPFYPSSQPQQTQQFYSQYPQQSFAPQQEQPIEIDDEEYESESPIEPPKPRSELDIAFNGINGDDPLPATPLMLCVDRLYQSYNNLILDFFPESGIAVPPQHDIKESAEFNVKTFRDACQELTAEFTRSAVEWQLVNPQEYYDDEIKDLEKSFARQTEIQKRVEGKINNEISKSLNGDKSRRV